MEETRTENDALLFTLQNIGGAITIMHLTEENGSAPAELAAKQISLSEPMHQYIMNYFDTYKFVVFSQNELILQETSHRLMHFVNDLTTLFYDRVYRSAEPFCFLKWVCLSCHQASCLYNKGFPEAPSYAVQVAYEKCVTHNRYEDFRSLGYSL